MLRKPTDPMTIAQVPAARTLTLSFRAYKNQHEFAPPPATPDEHVRRLMAVYRELKPVLDALRDFGLVPPLWKSMIDDFTSAVENVCAEHFADPASPDFKAGRDL